MSYIGKEPQVGAYHMLDSLTASATADYTLQLDSVNFVPESANHLIVSLNGVIQKAGSSFTVSGSTLSFSSALTSSDSIDFVLSLGNVLDIGTPSDSTVTNAKTNFVSTSSSAGLQIKGDGTTDGTLQLNCSQNSHGIKLKSPSHASAQSYTLTFPTTSPATDKFLKTDSSGNLSFADAGGTNTPSFHADKSSTTGINDNTVTDIVFDSENFDNGGCYDNSTGIFTVPSGEAGKYFIGFNVYYEDNNGNVSDMIAYIHTTISSSASQNAVARAESTSNGTTFTELNLNYSTILTLGVGDQVKVQAYIDTNNSSAMSIKGGGNKTTFFGYKIIE